MKDPIKNYKKLILENKMQEAEKKLPQIYKYLDKAAKHGTIKKNAASRKKSRLTKMLAKAKK